MSLVLWGIVAFSSAAHAAGAVERWGVFELSLKGPSTGNPYVDVQWSATFTQEGQSVKVPGFWDSASTYKLRFSPPTTGTWTYQTSSATADLNGKTGSIQVTEATGGNHGPVQVYDTFYLRYADSARYHQFGTTCYAWVHQLDSIQERTLNTLDTAPFNKMRMTVFPKDYSYNKNDPQYYAFQQTPGYPKGCSTSPTGTICTSYSFDFTKLDPAFWHNYDKRILDLQKRGIEADIILFHPYDRWGFKSMGFTNDNRYLRYCIARFSAYRNVWWSLANEWQFCDPPKKDTDFVRFAKIVMNEDPHHRMCSVHCCDYCYWAAPPAAMEYSQPYFTHAGIQGSCEDRGMSYRNQWKKPVIWDESIYEGNIPGLSFANLTAQQMSKRFWDATFQGTYQGHSECFADPRDVLWWGKGGTLKGQSPRRIQWFKDLMAQAPPLSELKPQSPSSAISILGKQGLYYLVYCQNKNSNTIQLTGTSSYKVDRLDPYNMTQTSLGTTSPGSYAFTPPDTNLFYRFVSQDYTPIEAKAAAATRREPGGTVEVVSNAGGAQTLRMEFERSVLKRRVTICLFDVAGRLAATQFTGRLSSTRLALPLNRTELRRSVYVIRVSTDNGILLKKTIALQ